VRAFPLLTALVAASLAVSVCTAKAEPPSNVTEDGAVLNSAPRIGSVPSSLATTTATAATVAAEPAAPKSEAVLPAKAAVAKPKPVGPSLIARINLATQRLELTSDGQRQASWPISSGRSEFPTPRGVFRPQWTSKMWFSKKYDDAPMPHSVFFTGGVAVHGTQSTGLLGQPASHGCVRLAPGNARQFYELVHKHGLARTRIEVFGTPPSSRVARKSPDSRNFAGTGRQGQSVASLRRAANGMVYLPPGSRYQGRSSFVLNGVTYVRVR
jgi:lipoprotein-anchoring transpeptidase ErfK/SrfK